MCRCGHKGVQALGYVR